MMTQPPQADEPQPTPTQPTPQPVPEPDPWAQPTVPQQAGPPQQSAPPPPWSAPAPPPGPPTWAAPAPNQQQWLYPPPAPPRKKRRGLLVTLVVVPLLLLLGGGGAAAWLLLKASEGTGATSPSNAVNDFLVAVYQDKDVAAATRLVCRESRKKADIQAKIDQVTRYGQDNKEPKFVWAEPTESDVKTDSAHVDVRVKISTADEKVAEEALRFTTVKRKGWFVCEVQPGATG